MMQRRLPALDDARQVRLRQISRDTGLSLPTLSRHARDLPIRYEARTLEFLCGYFNCGTSALLEFTLFE